ncbi:hypothetical protein C8J57DRAFT_667513 [Mycena rebaudengoi]|nr:hypothetical protein C8J57DRAFT_667513 [Mycena rebaudengoi]
MAASSPPVSRRQTGTTIGLAVALGGMIFIAGAIIGFVLCRRRRNPKQYPPHKHIPPQDGRSLRSYFVPTSRTTQRGNYSTLDDASAHDTDMSYMSSVPLRSVNPPPTTVTDPWERQGSVNVYRDVSESSGSHYTPRTAPTEISLPAGAKPAVPFLDGTALDDALSSSSSSISRTVSSHLAVATHPNHGRSAGLPAYSES